MTGSGRLRGRGYLLVLVVSCVDWYGHARPSFYRDRVHALLGYELVEGEPESNGIHEAFRLQYLTPAR